MSGLAHWELQFLQRLITDPQWAHQRAGRAALLQSLASAIVKEREPAKIEVMLSIAANQQSEQTWRRRSLLDGIAANVANRPVRLISFDAEPAAFAALANLGDPHTREQSAKIKTLFAWPGHQSDRVEAQLVEARALTAAEEVSISEGKGLYQQLCAGCHGLFGQGIAPMAPPLQSSEWVLGSENRLVRIVLQGVSGPITVNGATYAPPRILPEMPGLAVLDDSQLASVVSFIRRAWEHGAEPIAASQVARIRQETQERIMPWREEELLQIE